MYSLIFFHIYIFYMAAAAAAKLPQSCPTLCDPIDGSPPGSSVPGILQARILEWVAISFSNACKHANSLQSCPILCDPMDSSPQAPLSTGFSRQEYWNGLPFLPPGDPSHPGIEPASPVSPALQQILYPVSQWGSLFIVY